jgi:hypothetical protein
MPVSTTTMMVGPGVLRRAPVGTDDAAIIAAATPTYASAWETVGATDGGIGLTIAKSYANHSVDQAADWVASTITERHAQLEISLVEMSLSNLKISLNGGTITTGSGTGVGGAWDKYEPATDLIATQEEYGAFAIEGKTLSGLIRVIVIRRCLNVADVTSSFKKDEKTMLASTWAGHFVSDSIPPFVVYTQKAA